MASHFDSVPRPRTGIWRTLAVVVLLAFAGGMGYLVRGWMAGTDLRQARAAAKRHRVETAVTAYRRHLAHRPRDAVARLELAAVLKRRDPNAALAEYRAIPIDAPEMVGAARQVAAICLELGRDYDALGPLLFLQNQLPKDAGVQLALSEIRFRERKFDAALGHAQRCRALQPDLTGAYLIAAEALDELQRPGEMMEPLNALLQLHPEFPAAHLNLAYAYQTLERYDEAFEHIQWYLRRDTKTAAAYRILAAVEQGRGHLTEALKAAQRALQLQPHELEAGLLEGALLLTLKQPEKAYQHLTELAAYFGHEERLLTLRIQSAQQSGRVTEAQDLQTRLTRLTANRVESIDGPTQGGIQSPGAH